MLLPLQNMTIPIKCKRIQKQTNRITIRAKNKVAKYWINNKKSNITELTSKKM